MPSPPEVSAPPISRQRVVPRPSERRPHVSRVQGDLGEVRAAHDLFIAVGSPSQAVSIKPTSTSQPEESAWPAATLRVLGVLGGIGAGVCLGALSLFERADTAAGVIIAPAFTLIGAIAIAKYVRPRAGEFVAAAALAGLGARLVGSIPRLLTAADAELYQREGVRISQSLQSFDFAVETGRAIPGTGSVRYFSGLVNVVTAGNYVTTFLVFAVIAFVGQVFMLLAVQPVLNQRQMRAFAVLVMFSPTMVYWPSSIGKESLTLFGIGLAFFGASRLYDRRWVGIFPALLGGFAVGLVRPHVAMLLLAGLVVGLLARNPRTRRTFATHVVVLTLFIVGAMLTTGASAQLFNLESFDGISDVSAALDFAEDRTTQDASEFRPARVNSVVDYPRAVVTVLFRPFVWEASGVLAMASALEGLGLAILAMYSSGGVISEIKTIASRSQLLFATAFTSIFIFVFAAIGNFGILTRQRAQVVPFVLLLIAVGLGAERFRGSRKVSS